MVKLALKFMKSFSGELAVSAFHFILNLTLMTKLALTDYGFFALIFLLVGLAIATISGFTVIPLSILSPQTNSLKQKQALEVIYSGIGVIITLIVSLIGALFIYFWQNSWNLTYITFAFIAIFTLKTSIKGLLFARNKQSEALIGDMAYCINGFIGLIILILSNNITLENVIYLICLAQTLSIILLLVIKREKLRLSFSKTSYRYFKHHSLQNGLYDAVSTFVSFIQSHTQSFAVALFYTSAAFAPLAAGLVLFGPFRTATMALGNTLRPEFSKGIKDKNYATLQRTFIIGISFMTLMSLGFLATIWAFWGYIYPILFETKFSEAPMGLIIFLNGIAALFYTNANVVQFFLQGAQHNEKIMRGRIIGAIIALLAITPLLRFFKLEYSILALILAEGASLIYLSFIAFRIFRNYKAR